MPARSYDGLRHRTEMISLPTYRACIPRCEIVGDAWRSPSFHSARVSFTRLTTERIRSKQPAAKQRSSSLAVLLTSRMKGTRRRRRKRRVRIIKMSPRRGWQLSFPYDGNYYDILRRPAKEPKDPSQANELCSLFSVACVYVI